MIHIKPIVKDNACDFIDTTYQEMSSDDKRRMIEESLRKEHEGTYFEILAVLDDKEIVGFMSLYAHSDHVISIAPEIKTGFRRKNYGTLGELQALQYAKDAGYTMAIASVREDNPASIALHEKLGFEAGAHCLSKRGHPIRIYVKAL